MPESPPVIRCWGSPRLLLAQLSRYLVCKSETPLERALRRCPLINIQRMKLRQFLMFTHATPSASMRAPRRILGRVGSVSGSSSPPREGHGLINHLQTGFIPPNRSLGAHPVVRAEHSVSSSMECRPASHDQLRRHHLVAGRACPSQNRARPACRTRPVVVRNARRPSSRSPLRSGSSLGAAETRALNQIEREGAPGDCAALPEVSALPVVRSQMLHFTNVRQSLVSRCHRPGRLVSGRCLTQHVRGSPCAYDQGLAFERRHGVPSEWT